MGRKLIDRGVGEASRSGCRRGWELERFSHAAKSAKFSSDFWAARIAPNHRNNEHDGRTLAFRVDINLL